MIFSLPSYRRFAEASIKHSRTDGGRATADRLGAMLFNIALLASLWGVTLYARRFVLSNVNIVGKWRTTDGSHFQITFTRDGQFVLSWKETIVETAHYWCHNDNQNEVLISDFFKQPGNRAMGDEMCWLHVSATSKKLSTKLSFFLDEQWKRKALWHGSWQIEGEKLSLVPAVFERVE